MKTFSNTVVLFELFLRDIGWWKVGFLKWKGINILAMDALRRFRLRTMARIPVLGSCWWPWCTFEYCLVVVAADAVNAERHSGELLEAAFFIIYSRQKGVSSVNRWTKTRCEQRASFFVSTLLTSEQGVLRSVLLLPCAAGAGGNEKEAKSNLTGCWRAVWQLTVDTPALPLLSLLFQYHLGVVQQFDREDWPTNPSHSPTTIPDSSAPKQQLVCVLLVPLSLSLSTILRQLTSFLFSIATSARAPATLTLHRT